ncbi:isoaspartyl peptidase/L-asparaginase [Myxococcus llanfairpwllgwyngyllgogerychwyrndrobwllllantysiliogogogochensis]|uniref:Isoaspartyl peptidase n=1 Tax=Myxococcus llanfairpwllgwyngyllgogerychwyrndrobwllllantysiliogogogochensis TaxID=2590453 RepID=A0A540WZF2_9BACT|nr:isoaspartyl peptidase/L-asparaginase [Myxococcus llanfairpwllgwyngyllgogerychwyrndrobwllllantysiliogogogochensis]TQF13834.1 isoaspartyl peptidase/L-asparaginase [Myxococcus llanfairpwllgwyngyllgogerychwyrndrobwllllantysiliogogogochensis]
MFASLPSLPRSLVAGTALLLIPMGCTSAESARVDDARLTQEGSAARKPRWGLVIHGGAGVISRENLSAEREAEVRAVLQQALQAGHSVLAQGGSSLDAVTAAIRILEDSPHFNAGKGAVFNHDGINELDAAIMDGTTRAAGAVAGLRHVKNPIELARRVMEKSPHVMMIGEGAESFAKAQGVELVDAKYFFTEERWQSLQRALEKERATPAPGQPSSSLRPGYDPVTGDHKFGTVGAVALDQAGNLAAGTSTGGMTNKRYGRVGDAPIIGAGTYADPRCAVSATGHGEFFIRYTVARDICARVEYQELPLPEAANVVVHDVLVKAGGEGGVIAMDREGNVAMPFNSSGMYRGYVGQDGQPHVAIFKDPAPPASK